MTEACKCARRGHNGGMRAFIVPGLLLAASLLAGCGRAPPSATLPVVGAGDGRAAWAGVLACVDCDGVAVRLVLERDGARRRYLLQEIYLLAGGGVRFSGGGQWRMEAGLLRLRGDDGSLRTYAVDARGQLQARDSRGRALPVQDDVLLAPIAPARP